MLDWFRSLDPLIQAALAGGFTWFITLAGAALVLFTRRVSQVLLRAMLGFSAGVMIAASVWSLLIPSIDLAEAAGDIPWVPAAVGLLAGAALLRLVDLVLPHLHPGPAGTPAEGISTTWRRATLLVLAITLHNIPEGLAVGVAFGAAAINDDPATRSALLSSAITLAVGIGLQNFPEGIAVAMPLRGEGVSRLRSFWYGQLSASVEPAAAVIGAAAVVVVQPILPYALAFAAGAMFFVVVEELIPEAQEGESTDIATLATILGFIVMMVLDVALG